MKTGFKWNVIIDSEKYGDIYNGKDPITIKKIKDDINNGIKDIEFVDNFLANEGQPTIIIKL